MAQWTEMTRREVPYRSELVEIIWKSARPPGNDFDHVQLRQVVGVPKGPPVLLLPGAIRNTELPSYSEHYSLLIFLALKGINAFGFDPRWHQVPLGIDEFGFMRHWTIQTFLDDIQSAIQKIKDLTGHDRIYLAGFSRGGEHALYYANSRWKEDLAGLIILDGILWPLTVIPSYSLDFEEVDSILNGPDTPEAREALKAFKVNAHFSIHANENEIIPKARTWYEENCSLIEELLVDFGDCIPQVKREQIADHLTSSIPWEAKAYSHILALIADFRSSDRYGPLIQILESIVLGDQGTKYPRLPYLDRIEEVDIPLIAFFSTNNPSKKVKGPEAILSTDVEIRVLSKSNHFDVMYGRHAYQKVYEPIYQWLCDHS